MDTSVHYIARTRNLKTEKAFTTDFPVDHVDGARRTNTEPDHRRVTVTAIDDPSKWKLDVHGFCVVHGRTNLDTDKVYTDKAAVQEAYFREIEAIIHSHFPQYSRIECFDLTARKRDPDFPAVVRVYRETHEQPSEVAHCDWSQRGSLPVLNWCFPGNEDFWEGKKFDMLKSFRLGLGLVYGLARPISVIISSDPDDGIERQT
ncbi:hypothetical protein GE09DRAFT_1216591 [Coniochaeta sp. 2T2.1]|nr:hypothetical protein GE09DRAFT_1216591 [Coniochaeta sp. 2T2.1]